MPETPNPHPVNVRRLLRNFVIELAVYAFLVIIYFIAVLNLLNGYLTNLFENNLHVYAYLGLFLILAQGVLLDALTSFLLDQIKLERFD